MNPSPIKDYVRIRFILLVSVLKQVSKINSHTKKMKANSPFNITLNKEK